MNNIRMISYRRNTYRALLGRIGDDLDMDNFIGAVLDVCRDNEYDANEVLRSISDALQNGCLSVV